MNKSRLEAFSDGVIAIIITIMVLELKVPHSNSWSELHALWPIFVSYVLSFVYVGIYWVNHHHMLQLVKTVNARVLWTNLLLLFWLSLLPFATAWMGQNHFADNTVALYGASLLLCGFAYDLLVRAVRSAHGVQNMLGHVATNRKGNISLILYGVAIAVAYAHTAASLIIYAVVAFIWFIPDRRIEKALSKKSE